ncbi:sulfurase, partial [Shimia thalassica]|nr:sulfurase [Shimia thalassica]
MKPTVFFAVILWLGQVADSVEDLRALEVEEMDLGFEGFEGECHDGLTSPSCSRVFSQNQRGTEIANTRQIYVLSAE